ncbi:C40 family peptidase [Pikeienuella piscinae]|uniref:C40 family peptidase n=1 Tax=Pikeienuella piscinae TaxID=2748098 RepID=A0A7L5C2L9_9RHOB|nr:NlpC/P60 family protein [Pikeienuella piscinae]QIE56454.1 C40 family peptidase [Pikeienuella piscinae]
MADDPFEGDPRITPVRPDLAPLHLRGVVEAGAYASDQPMRVSVAVAPLSAAPDADSEQVSQLLFGEDFTAYEVERGWAWGQSALDGYVGYVPEADLMNRPETEPTHRVATLQALIYPEPDMKSRPIGAVPFGARMTVRPREETGGFAALDPGGYAALAALKPLDAHDALWVATAERFLGAPYLWGGRSAAGFDCSGLVQTALHAAGVDCPRDSDMQMAALGREVSAKTLKRGDLVFWRRHVGIMTSPSMLLHANAHHMAVVSEAFETARARIAKAEFGEIVGVRRLTI